jgi:hypothetical protein
MGRQPKLLLLPLPQAQRCPDVYHDARFPGNGQIKQAFLGLLSQYNAP